MTEPSLPARPQGAIDAFREISDRFLELARTPPGGSLPMYSSNWVQLKYLLRHPARYYATTVREGNRAQSGVGAFAPWYPWEAMVDFLERYSEPQLIAAKSVSEVNLRRVKSMFQENPFFKLSVPIGSAYAVLQLTNKLTAVHGSTLEFYRKIMALPAVQSFMGYLLLVFIWIVITIAFAYLWRTGPTIARAQLLDDILLVALEEKRLARTMPSNPTRDGA